MSKKVKGQKGNKFSFGKEFPKITDAHCIIMGNSGPGISQTGEILEVLKTRKS